VPVEQQHEQNAKREFGLVFVGNIIKEPQEEQEDEQEPISRENNVCDWFEFGNKMQANGRHTLFGI
jgi:2,4-dienoyl-CoA reductase-like NADH-dependent reductase (Old Yellow Enzyme family)